MKQLRWLLAAGLCVTGIAEADGFFLPTSPGDLAPWEQAPNNAFDDVAEALGHRKALRERGACEGYVGMSLPESPGDIHPSELRPNMFDDLGNLIGNHHQE